MKKIFKIIGIGIIILIIGGIGGLLVNYVVFAKISTHPVWSQNSLVKTLDNRIKIIKTIEKVVVADNESIADIASRAAGSVVYVEVLKENGEVNEGNGIIVSSDGIIATTEAVVPTNGVKFMFAKLADEVIFDVKQIYHDEYSGLVFLRIDAQNLSTISFANSDDARSGKRLISISKSRSSNEDRFALGGFFGRDNLFSIKKPISDFLQGVLLIDFSQSVLEQSVGAPVIDFKGNMV
jgi:S1-C subfamily serine protease